MSDIIILASRPVFSSNCDRTAYYFEAQCEYKKANIYISELGLFNICCENSSHRAFRGMGRTFRGLDEALAGYKSPEMRSIITAGARAALEHWRGCSIKPGRHEFMIELTKALESEQNEYKNGGVG
jgi:hypothetical protein